MQLVCCSWHSGYASFTSGMPLLFNLTLTLVTSLFFFLL